jgi:transcriptional regulator with XRE-family HTH domain
MDTEKFTKKLNTLFDYYGINASAFADEIGVQRSSLSHLLSGRNKPSLDLILKIVDKYPEVDMYWLVKDIGSFPKDENTHQKQVKTEQINPKNHSNTNRVQTNLFEPHNTSIETEFEIKNETKEINQLAKLENEVEKIVFFYRNGTFKVYN